MVYKELQKSFSDLKASLSPKKGALFFGTIIKNFAYKLLQDHYSSIPRGHSNGFVRSYKRKKDKTRKFGKMRVYTSMTMSLFTTLAFSCLPRRRAAIKNLTIYHIAPWLGSQLLFSFSNLKKDLRARYLKYHFKLPQMNILSKNQTVIFWELENTLFYAPHFANIKDPLRIYIFCK